MRAVVGLGLCLLLAPPPAAAHRRGSPGRAVLTVPGEGRGAAPSFWCPSLLWVSVSSIREMGILAVAAALDGGAQEIAAMFIRPSFY